MVKLSRFALAAILSLETAWLASVSAIPKAQSSGSGTDNFSFIDNMLLESSRYTQTEDSDLGRLATYHSKYTLAYTEDQLSSMGFSLMLEDSSVKVYFEKDSFSAIVINKASGYQWSSRPEFQGFSGSREDNTAARNLMNSGLWVDYVISSSVSSSNITTASLYTFANCKYQTDGSYKDTNPDQTRPYLLTAGSYDETQVVSTVTAATSGEFTVHLDLLAIGASFDVSIALGDGLLDVSIPNESISESDSAFQLLGIYIFPYMGASREDKIPGYIVIPDGMGALVRTDKQYNTYFQSDFYGNDFGYANYTLSQLSVPIYGIVHEAGGNAWYANILEGSESSTLISRFWGKNTHYQRIGSRFNVRTIYRKIINQAGDGYDAVPDDIIPASYKVRYSFLSGSNASYVGMAKNYRNYLLGQAVLTAREKAKESGIPLELSYILDEREPAFIGTARLSMTTPSQVQDAYDYFADNGISNQQLVLMGWSTDGATNRAPYRLNFTKKNDLKTLVKHVTQDGNAIYLDNDYVVSSDLSKRVSYNSDVARSLSRLKLASTNSQFGSSEADTYILNPSSSLEKAKNDVRQVSGLGVSGLSLDSLGNTLFSYYDNAIYYRSDSIRKYQQIAGLYGSMALSVPSQYLFAYTDDYLDLPLTNAQFDYYTDLVPLIPIILKGSVSYYTPYLNFNALGIDRLLSMVDFAINPSFILTQKPSTDMRYTESKGYYTTTLSDFDEEVIQTYDYLNAALKNVAGAAIDNREMLATGFSKVTYSNGVVIYVNYANSAQTNGSVTVSAHDYLVVMP